MIMRFGGFKINKPIIMLITLAFMLAMSCANAEDLNETCIDSVQNDVEELEVNMDSDDILSQSDDIALEAKESSINRDIPKVEDKSLSKSSADSKSQSYLILDNDADNENIYIGDQVTWIVSVINNGQDTAKKVKVFDQLPDGLKYIRHSTTKGTFNPDTGIWDIGNLSISDGEVFLYIVTQAFSIGEKINKANLTSDTFNLNENESYEEEEIDVFEPTDEKDAASKVIYSDKPAGNPISLIVISLLAIMMATFKSRRF